MSEASTYSISELEELSGIPAHTIRTWERRYKLLNPSRNACNVRRYHASDVSFLHHLASLLKQGHRISTLACKSRDEISSLALESAPETTDTEATGAIYNALQDFNVQKVESLMSCYIRKEGFDNAMIYRFAPFLNRMNFLLFSGTLKSPHTQIFTSALRQKIYTALDSMSPPRDAPRWVLLEEAGSSSTVYGDIMHYLLRKNGKQVVPGGPMRPDRAREFIKDMAPDGFCLIAGGELSEAWLQEMLVVLSEYPIKPGNIMVFTPGDIIDIGSTVQIPNVKTLTSLQEAFECLMKA